MNEQFNTWADSLRGNKSIAAVIVDASATTPKAAGKTTSSNNARSGRSNGKSVPGMHLGRGYRYGNITWFPIWTDAHVVDRDYITDTVAGKVAVVEGDVPSVGFLNIKNDCDQPVLLLEGTLLEGGWQHRAVTQTVVVAAKSTTQLPVVCVEAGRWGGAVTQKLGTRRAPAGVRSAIRGVRKSTGGQFMQAAPDQGEVWNKVREFGERNNKIRPTESLVEMRNEIEAEIAALKFEKPLPLYGQRGALIAIGGIPLAIEVFDHPDTLAERLESILDAYLPESLTKRYKACRSQMARDFIERIERVGVDQPELDGRLRNRPDKYVAAEAVFRNGSLLHMSALNAAHELVLTA
jgi:hypothetical protein